MAPEHCTLTQRDSASLQGETSSSTAGLHFKNPKCKKMTIPGKNIGEKYPQRFDTYAGVFNSPKTSPAKQKDSRSLQQTNRCQEEKTKRKNEKKISFLKENTRKGQILTGSVRKICIRHRNNHVSSQGRQEQAAPNKL